MTTMSALDMRAKLDIILGDKCEGKYKKSKGYKRILADVTTGVVVVSFLHRTESSRSTQLKHLIDKVVYRGIS